MNKSCELCSRERTRTKFLAHATLHADPRFHATRARLACPLGNAKDALDTIA